MNSKRAIIVIALMLLILSILLATSCRDRVTEEEYARLSVGMSEDSVYAIIGTPDEIGDGEITVQFKMELAGVHEPEKIRGSKALTYYGSNYIVNISVDNCGTVRSITSGGYESSTKERIGILMHRVARVISIRGR